MSSIETGRQPTESETPPYDSDMVSFLTDSLSGESTAAVTADDMGRFMLARGGQEMNGRQAFYALHKALADPRVVDHRFHDEVYEYGNRATHIGIKVSALPEIADLIKKGELHSLRLREMFRQVFLDFTDELFRPLS
jgi:hypothetical protein